MASFSLSSHHPKEQTVDQTVRGTVGNGVPIREWAC